MILDADGKPHLFSPLLAQFPTHLIGDGVLVCPAIMGHNKNSHLEVMKAEVLVQFGKVVLN